MVFYIIEEDTGIITGYKKYNENSNKFSMIWDLKISQNE